MRPSGLFTDSSNDEYIYKSRQMRPGRQQMQIANRRAFSMRKESSLARTRYRRPMNIQFDWLENISGRQNSIWKWKLSKCVFDMVVAGRQQRECEAHSTSSKCAIWQVAQRNSQENVFSHHIAMKTHHTSERNAIPVLR